MAYKNNTDSDGFLPPAEQIKRNKESLLAKPSLYTNNIQETNLNSAVKPPEEQIAENKAQASGETEFLPPLQQIQSNKASLTQPKLEQVNSLNQRIQSFDPENPDYFVEDYIKNLDVGKSIYEAHKANPKLKFGVKQSMAMMDYYNSPNNTDRHPFVNAVTGLVDFAGKAIRGVQEVATDVTKASSPLSFLTGVSPTGLGIGEGGAGAGMFSPSDSYDSKYQQWSMQAYANRQKGLPEPPKPEPPKKGENSVYYQSPQDAIAQAEYQKKYAEWSKNAGIWNVLTGKGMPSEPKYQQPPETETQKLKSVAGDVGTVADLVAGVPLDVYQITQKAQQGGIELADSLGLAIDPNSGVLSYQPKTKSEKLVNFMTRNDIDADRARVNAKAPSSVGKILYYAGEKPTNDGGQQSYAQLLRPLLASYLVPSVKERMLKDQTLTEGQATQQWMKDSEMWGSSNLQKWASQIPAEKENVAAAAQLLIPETTIFAPAIGVMSTLGKGLREAARLEEISSLMPEAQAMTDVAQTAKEGGTFYVDPNGNITAGPKTNTSVPRTKEQMREDMYHANLLHKDLLENIEASRLERSSGTEIKLGPWGVPKPYLWADGISQRANTAADTIKQYATAGALGTAIPLTTGAIGAYKHRNEGPLGIGEGFLKGVEYGAAGELAGYTALKGIGKTAGVLADIGKVQQGLKGTGGNVFNIAGNLPTSTKATKDIFGGKIGKITSPTANYLANNLSQWAYQGVEAGTLAAALGILESTPHEDMPSQVANGIAMMMVPHIISSAIHESPAAREKRLGQENASIYWAKKDASNDTKRNMNDIRDYRNVVNDQKGVVFQKDQDLRTLLVNPKSKPEDINKAKDAYQEADEKLTQLMSANAETMHEYGRQQDLLFANIHRGLNGPLRAGQSNIGLEILTKDQILQKLVDQNKELASTPQGMAKLEMIAGQDGMVINSAGGVELRAGTDLAEALKNEPIMFDPSKTTAIINSDNARTRAGVYGTTTYDAISHEGGHLYPRTEEFQKANSELLSQLFSTNIYHNDGTIASEDFGAVSNDQLKDMIWNNYLKGRTDEQKKDWLESQGMWDRANDRFIDKEVIPYAREEYIAEMVGNSLHQMTSRGGETAVMKWARVNNSNNMLARSIQSVLGNGGPDPTKPSPVMGIKFTPEIAAATEKAIQAVNDYNGHIAPVIDAQPVVEITQQELKKNKGLLKKYGIQSGMFQTQIFATIRDANGNIVGKVPVSNEATPEGSWKIDPNTRRPVQTNGYGQIPDEVNNVQIPEGGSLDVKREVSMQPDGESPVMLSDSQIKKNQKVRRDLILNALGIIGEIPEQGITWRGTFTPEQIQNIKNLPENVVPKAIKDVILSMNETLASGEGKRWLAEYSPTSGKKGKRKSLMMKMYDVVPIGMHFTKDGNFNITAISATRLFNKIHAWGAEFPHILGMWGGDKSAFFNDFVTKYLANWQQGKEGWEGLDPDEKTAKIKRDIFDNFLNLKDKDTEHLNQNRFYLKGKMADLDRTIMSMRADHVSSLQPSSAQPIPVDYYKAKINAMPESGLPYQERPEEGEESLKPLTFAPKGEQPALTPEILKGITAVHVPATNATSEIENTRSITRQYGEYPKGTKVVVVGQRSKDPLDTNIPVQFPDGKVEKFPISWLKSDATQGQGGNLAKLVKDQGRDAVNILLGEWDQNAVLNPDGTGIVSAIDPRESMKKTKVPTRDFTDWLKGQDIEAILAEQGEEPVKAVIKKDNRQNVGISFMPKNEEEYSHQTGHRPADEKTGAPMHEMTRGIYPDDFYTLPFGTAVRYYGDSDSEGYSAQSLSAILAAKGNPDAKVKVYRAVPRYEKQDADRINKINEEINKLVSESVRFSKLGGDINANDAKIKELQAQLPKELNTTINAGDWVTPSRTYARMHGESALLGVYKILSKSVPASHLFTEGNSLSEFGYNPPAKKSDISFMPSSKLDEAHAKAIESGDMEEAQRLVDERARQAGYDITAYHGSPEKGVRVLSPKKAIEVEGAVFLSSNPDVADQYRYERAYGDIIGEDAGDIIDARIKLENPYIYEPKGKIVDAIEFGKAIDYAKKNGNDGVIVNDIDDSVGMTGDMGTTYAVFNPEQIKSADPATYDDQGKLIPLSQRFDTSKPDIRFMPKSEEQEPKNLVAVHNTSAEKIENALKIGGFAVPSVAIIRNDRSQFDSFGDITLVAPKGLINPEEEKKSKVFNADVYSPRYPSVSYALNEKDGKKIWSDINSKIKDVPEDRKLSFSFQSNQRDKPLSEELTENPAVQLAFVYETGNQDKINWPEKTEESKYYQEQGIKNALRQKLSKWWGDKNSDLHKEFTAWVEKLTSDLGITDQEKLFAGHAPSGTRRYLPHTIENVVKMMTKSIRDGEGFNYGVGSIRSKAAKQFRTMKSIEKSRESIISNEQMEGLKDEVNNEFESIVDESAKTRANQGRDGFVMDAVSSDIKAFAEGGSENMKYLREMYPEGAPYKLWSDYLEKLRGLPTEYFEAKIQRGVDLNEFAGAVVPEGTSQDLINKLENKGLDVVTYPKGDKAARAKAVQGISGKRSDIAFMPKGQTQAAKPIDWSVFTQKTEKPLSTIRAYAVPQQKKDKSY